MDILPTLGDALRKLRVDAGMKQEELAAACTVRGINQGSLSRWERNESGPSPEQLRDLARAAGASIETLSRLLSMLVGLPVQIADQPAEGA